MSWEDYKGMEVPSTTSGDAGAALKTNFMTLADRAPKADFAATSNPTATDDSTEGYEVGSQWINTATGAHFVCADNTEDAAVWLGSWQANSTGDPRGQDATDLQRVRLFETDVASGDYSMIGGGVGNTASGNHGVVAGGVVNVAAERAAVGGGSYNSALGSNSTIGGGFVNVASGDESTVAGGKYNFAGGGHSVVGGGYSNQTMSLYGFIGGGVGNYVNGVEGIVCGGDANVASGNYSAIVGGTANTAEGDYSAIGGGTFNIASGDASVAMGTYAIASRFGQLSQAAGAFNEEHGSAQRAVFILRAETLDDTPTELSMGGVDYLTVPPDGAFLCLIQIIALEEGATNAMAFTRQCLIVNNGGTTALVGSVITIGTDLGSSGWSVSITADNTNDRLAITVTGASSTNIRWVATVYATEVKYA